MTPVAELHSWSEDMGEISGFGGSYEAALRAMVLAGVAWSDRHPEADPKFKVMENVTGICLEDNEPAKELTKVMHDAANAVDARGGVTGAMHHFAVVHVLWIRTNGWDAYVAERRKKFGGAR